MLWWDSLRSLESVRSIIRLVYANKTAADDALVARIVESTLHPAALEAFISIVLAPKAARSFEECLVALRAAGTPVCLVYGREDPWVRSTLLNCGFDILIP